MSRRSRDANKLDVPGGAALPRTTEDLAQGLPEVGVTDGVTHGVEHAVDVAQPVAADHPPLVKHVRPDGRDDEDDTEREPADGEGDEQEGDGAERLAVLLLRRVPAPSRRLLRRRLAAVRRPVTGRVGPPRPAGRRVGVDGRRRQFDLDRGAAGDTRRRPERRRLGDGDAAARLRALAHVTRLLHEAVDEHVEDGRAADARPVDGEAQPDGQVDVAQIVGRAFVLVSLPAEVVLREADEGGAGDGREDPYGDERSGGLARRLQERVAERVA